MKIEYTCEECGEKEEDCDCEEGTCDCE